MQAAPASDTQVAHTTHINSIRVIVIAKLKVRVIHRTPTQLRKLNHIHSTTITSTMNSNNKVAATETATAMAVLTVA